MPKRWAGRERAHDEGARLRNIGVVARLTPNTVGDEGAIGSDQHEERARSPRSELLQYIIRRCDVM